MNLSDQVCSLELAKKLKELGVNTESYFYWFKLSDKDNYDLSESWQIADLERFDMISAFTVGELGELLPGWNPFPKYLWMAKSAEFEIQYRNDHTEQLSQYFSGDKEADIRAKMLIYLIENELMEVPK